MDYDKIVIVREATSEYVVKGADDCAKAMVEMFEPYQRTEEHVWLVCLNAKGRVVGAHEVSHGGLITSEMSPRDVYKRALVNNAYAIIVAHNHLSGECEPSETDIETTKLLKNAGEVLGIKFLDHIIFGDRKWMSLKAEGFIEE